MEQSRKFKFIPVFEKVDYLITTSVLQKIEDSQGVPTGFNRPDDFRLQLYSLALDFGTELQRAADSICQHVGRVLQLFLTARGAAMFSAALRYSRCDGRLYTPCEERPSKSVLISLLKKADINFHHKLLAFLIEDCHCLKK